MKKCTKCGIEKDNNCFRKNGYRCKDCIKEYDKQYRLNNNKDIKKRNDAYYEKNKKQINLDLRQYRQEHLEEMRELDKQHYQKNIDYFNGYYEENKENILEKRREYYKENKEDLLEANKQYYITNKEKIIKTKNLYVKEKIKNNPSFKLRRIISRSVNYALHKLNFNKNNQSITKYLSYSFQELKIYLESQFESWMTWDNWGTYNSKTWDDNDSTTWTWQIDHIIPHSTFKYNSMEDQEFKNCWALSNLRPLSAKQNILDGVNRIRHKVKV